MSAKEFKKRGFKFFKLLVSFSLCCKTHAWIPRKYDVLLDCSKIQQLQLSLEEKSSFILAPEVAWCLSIVGQAANATYIRCLVQGCNYFASLQIVDASGAVFHIVTSSEIKAVELNVQWGLISTSNCFSSCFLHVPVGDPFYERCNAFNWQMWPSIGKRTLTMFC